MSLAPFALWIEIVIHEPVLGQLLVLRALLAVVGVGIDADASAGCEDARYLNVLRFHQPDEVFHDDVHAVFVEVAVIAEAEKVELQALALYHPFVGHIRDAYLCKVGLPRDGAEARELGAVELHPVVVSRMLVDKRLQHFRGIIRSVLGLRAERLQTLFVSFHSFLS